MGHQCDGKAVLDQATRENNADISAYITLSLDSKPSNTASKLNAPLLDVHGTENKPSSTNNDQWLKTIEKSGGRRMELPMADDYYSGQENNLIFLIANWLRAQ